MRRLLLLTTAILLLLPAWAKDDYSYRQITMNDGLAANAVRNIVQDKNGYIWFGTDNGLCRYDGMKVQPYRIGELGVNQYVSALMTDDEGLYVGTDKGVFFLSFERQTIERLPLDIHSAVTWIAKDKETEMRFQSLVSFVFNQMRENGKQ